jgi:hypothetical protein
MWERLTRTISKTLAERAALVAFLSGRSSLRWDCNSPNVFKRYLRVSPSYLRPFFAKPLLPYSLIRRDFESIVRFYRVDFVRDFI